MFQVKIAVLYLTHCTSHCTSGIYFTQGTYQVHVWLGNVKGKDELVGPKRRGKDVIKMDLKNMI
jgi:hypothetical protein